MERRPPSPEQAMRDMEANINNNNNIPQQLIGNTEADIMPQSARINNASSWRAKCKQLWRTFEDKITSSSSMPQMRNDDRGLDLTAIASTFVAGFEVTANNSSSQGGNDNEAVQHIDPESAELLRDGPANMSTAIALWITSLLTLIMVIATAVHKPARGVIFGHNKKAYYITLAIIFAFGVAEVLTAHWMSRSRDPNKRRFSFGRRVLLVSFGPLVAIAGIGGFTYKDG